MRSRGRAWTRSVGLVVLLACVGCERPPPRGGDAAKAANAADTAGTAGTAARDIAVGPAYRSPPGFPLPFTTVIPRELVAASKPVDGGGAAVSFTWDAGPARRDSAFLYVRVLPPETTAGAARELVRTAAERLRVPGDTAAPEPVSEHRWAEVEYPLRTVGRLYGQPVRGWVALGLHGGRWFYLIAQAPADEWRSFAARAEQVLLAWRWEDVPGEAGVPLDSVG